MKKSKLTIWRLDFLRVRITQNSAFKPSIGKKKKNFLPLFSPQITVPVYESERCTVQVFSPIPFCCMGFRDSSVGKESTCNAGDLGSIPGSGRSAGEGIGYPLQYSWASLVAQLVKNPPAMQETWVQSLGWEDPLEKGNTTHSSILAWRIPWTVWGHRGSQRVGHD